MEVSIDFSQLGMVQLGIVCAYIVTLIAGIKEIKGLSTRVIYFGNQPVQIADANATCWQN